MARSKIRILILLLSVLLFVFVTGGCTSVLEQFVYKQIMGDPYKDSLYESAVEANLKGLELIELDKVENSLECFDDAFTYINEYEELYERKKNNMIEKLKSDTLNNYCLAYYLLGEYEKSLDYGTLAIELMPNDSVKYSNRGNAYLDLYKYDEAMKDYDKAIELDFNNSYARYGKGKTYYNLEEYEESLREFNNYLQSEPDDIDAYIYIIWCHYHMGNYDEGIEVSDKALLIDDDVEVYDAKGYNIMAKSGFKEAEIYYKSITELYSNNIDAQMLLGMHYYNNYEYMDALEYFLGIRSKFDTDTNLNCWIISCYTALGHMDKADDYFQEVLGKGNGTVEFCNYVGDEFVYQVYNMESIQYYDEAIGIDKKDKTAYFNKLYALFYGKRYSRCIELGKNMIDIFGKDYDVMGYIGESHYYLCEYEDALEWYKSAYKLKSSNDVIVSCISDVYAILEDYDNARKYADEALLINKNNTTAINVKSTIENRQRPIEEQIKEFIIDNYLYSGNDSKVQEHFRNTNMTNLDINNGVESIKSSDDIFTFCIYDDLYNYYYEEYMSDVEYQDYENMDYIRIYDFNENTDDQVIEILDAIKEPASRILVIDLRMNGGGDTLAASNILDALLASCVTCTLIDKDGYTYNYYSDASQIKFKEIFILVDRYSASASELLTLGLKTYLDNVTVIGDNTYGKGVGQLVFEDKGSKLMVFLVNHFWNVREQNIKETGIAPDVHIISEELSDYFDVIKEHKDPIKTTEH